MYVATAAAAKSCYVLIIIIINKILFRFIFFVYAPPMPYDIQPYANPSNFREEAAGQFSVAAAAAANNVIIITPKN